MSSELTQGGQVFKHSVFAPIMGILISFSLSHQVLLYMHMILKSWGYCVRLIFTSTKKNILCNLNQVKQVHLRYF